MSVSTKSRLHRPYYRNGVNHRDGADVNFSDIVKIFGFKTATIGKWVTSSEQQLAANLMFDALCDLMDILQIPEKVISLSSSLSLAFGSGGQKHSSAHYDANTRTLALAKNAGGGALAHEWFHAFDHYICDKAFKNANHRQFATQCWLDNEAQIRHPINDRLSEFFRALFLDENHSGPNDYVLRAAQVDKALNAYYYARPQELGARAFEAIIQDQDIKNSFLVQGTKQSHEAKLGIYPDDAARSQMTSTMLDYFEVLGRAVEQGS